MSFANQDNTFANSQEQQSNNSNSAFGSSNTMDSGNFNRSSQDTSSQDILQSHGQGLSGGRNQGQTGGLDSSSFASGDPTPFLGAVDGHLGSNSGSQGVRSNLHSQQSLGGDDYGTATILSQGSQGPHGSQSYGTDTTGLGRDEYSQPTGTGQRGAADASFVGSGIGAGTGIGSDRGNYGSNTATDNTSGGTGIGSSFDQRQQESNFDSQSRSQGSDSYSEDNTTGRGQGFTSSSSGNNQSSQSTGGHGGSNVEGLKTGNPKVDNVLGGVGKKLDDKTDEDGFTNLTGDKQAGIFTGRVKNDANTNESPVIETTSERSERDEQGRELDSYGKPYEL